MDCHQRLAGDARQHDLDCAREHHQDALPAAAGLCEHLARADALAVSKGLQAINVSGVELREHLLPAGLAKVGHGWVSVLRVHARSSRTELESRTNTSTILRFGNGSGVPRTWRRRLPSRCSRTRFVAISAV